MNLLQFYNNIKESSKSAFVFMFLGGAGFITGMLLGKATKIFFASRLALYSVFSYGLALAMTIISYYTLNYTIIILAGAFYGSA